MDRDAALISKYDAGGGSNTSAAALKEVQHRILAAPV